MGKEAERGKRDDAGKHGKEDRIGAGTTGKDQAGEKTFLDVKPKDIEQQPALIGRAKPASFLQHRISPFLPVFSGTPNIRVRVVCFQGFGVCDKDGLSDLV